MSLQELMYKGTLGNVVVLSRDDEYEPRFFVVCTVCVKRVMY